MGKSLSQRLERNRKIKNHEVGLKHTVICAYISRKPKIKKLICEDCGITF